MRKQRQERATAKAKANAGILRFALNDKSFCSQKGKSPRPEGSGRGLFLSGLLGGGGVDDLDGQDFVGVDGDLYGVSVEGKVGSFGLFHKVGLDGVGGSGGDVELDRGGVAGPFVHAEDE